MSTLSRHEAGAKVAGASAGGQFKASEHTRARTILAGDLIHAAAASQSITPDSSTGKRVDDPLDKLITSESWTRYLAVVEKLSGREVTRFEDPAATLRSFMRRWIARRNHAVQPEDLQAALKIGPRKPIARNAHGVLSFPASTAKEDEVVRKWVKHHGPQFKIGKVELLADARSYLQDIAETWEQAGYYQDKNEDTP